MISLIIQRINKQVMIIVQLLGGMGNQMFQYACGRHLAILNNTELKLDLSLLENRVFFDKNFFYRSYDLDLFNIKASIATQSDIPLYRSTWRINSIPHRLFNLFQIKMEGFKYVFIRRLNSYNLLRYNDKVLKKRGKIYVAGYPFSARYFDSIRDIILEELSFVKDLPPACAELEEKIKTTNSVSINIRRKDFLVQKSIGTHGIGYINKAVAQIALRVSDPVFFVFSDDMEWCRENVKIDFPHHFVNEELSGKRNEDHLQLMTLCKHFIISNSTYGWWGAWLSNYHGKIVVAPNRLFQKLNDVDMIPQEWLRV